jgi:L-glyceraldehyde reductase
MSSGKTVALNTGYKIPYATLCIGKYTELLLIRLHSQLGYGTWQAAPGEVGNGVYEALKIGYRHLVSDFTHC